MEFYDIVMQALDEGVHDKNQYKAIFVLGPPGAGKSYVTRNYISDGTMKIVDNDIATVHLLRKQGLENNRDNDLDFSELSPEKEKQLQDIRTKAWELTGGGLSGASKDGTGDGLLQNYVKQGLGIIYSGSGANAQDQKVIYDWLEHNGYDIMLVVVTAPLNVCLQGNRDRTRKLRSDEIASKHKALEDNLPFYKKLFKQYFIFENTGRGSVDRSEANALVSAVRKFLQH